MMSDDANFGRVGRSALDEPTYCEVCDEEGGEFDDVVAEWWDGERNRLAHELCVPTTRQGERVWSLA